MESVGSLFNDNSGVKALITIIVLLIVYFIIFKMGSYVIQWAFGYSKSPYIFRGRIRIEDNSDKQIYTNPNANVFINDDVQETKHVKVIYRSTNQSGGVEFTWMTWLYVDGNSFSTGPNSRSEAHTMHIFNKGAKPIPATNNATNLANVAHMSCPGIYLETFPESQLTDNNMVENLDRNHNNMRLRIDCNTQSTSSVFETAYVYNIPINKWMHIVVRVIGNHLDVYINGRIKKRLQLYNVPLQNYGDIYLFANDKARTQLKGEMSDLRYFNYALESRTIEHFTEKGPTLDWSRDEGMVTNSDDTPYYLSQKWYYKDYLT